ncbi:ATP-binding protein [Ramlibacter sp. XY19]|uniref:ATP-binding protein n=1 Tax=Ramlibacter paludis TaxID=2908000 RepID=UPI0023D9B3DF|nr:ATP-binding protein [Ramlibacter paludis]MCG2592181.1 ATP-binding protein [Ramlibacter paludis]
MQNKNEPRVPDRLYAALIGLGYLLAGLVWIGFSDEAGSLLFSSSETLTRYQTYKGAAFVTVTALLVFVLAARRVGLVEPPPVRRRGPSLSALLAGLVLVTALPLVVLIGFDLVRLTESRATEANALAQGAAKSTASSVESFLEERARLAQVLARRPLVLAVHGDKCDPLLTEVAGLHEELRNIAVLDLQGEMVCAAHPGFYVPVTAQQLAGQGVGLVSPPVAAPAGPTLALTYPVRTPGNELVGSVQLLVAASFLERLVANDAPKGVVGTLITAQGYVLARFPALPGLLGKRMPNVSTFIGPLQGGGDRVVAKGIDGVERFYAMRRVGNSDLLAVAGVDVDETLGPVRAGALRSLGIAGAVLLLAALLVTSIVRRIAAPMKGLALAADAVAAGQFDRRSPEAGPREVAAVAAQFNRMLDRLPALEHALRESESRHRTLLEKLSRNIPGMIFQLRMTDAGHASLPFASEGILPLFEVLPEQVREDASPVLASVHPEDAEKMARALEDSRRGLSYLALEFRVLLPSRGLRHYLTYAQPEREEGSVLWHGCTVDVTPLEQAQQALRLANENLEARVADRTRALAAANESLESFSYSVAHDLRAPLQAIEGFSDALPALMQAGDRERTERLVQRIVANTAQMGRMIDGLLAVARAGKEQLADEEVALVALVQDLLAELKVPAGTRVDIGALPVVRADPASLRQVWWNLLANALKFTSRRDDAQVAIGSERQGDELVFFVRDNGAGFDPQFAGRLFTAFQRLHDANEFEGSGIGLALARRVVESHGGRIWAQGRPGEGATFYFSLPASRAA